MQNAPDAKESPESSLSNRQLFLSVIAQTSEAPLAIEIVKAEGCLLFDVNGKEYIDLIGGISVCNTGHRHPVILAAIKSQLEKYLHIMVYGELIQSPQVQYGRLLTEHLPHSLNCIFFTASGTEATEGAMKLSKRYTGRTEIIAFKNSYHGSTQGSLSLIGDEYWRNAFRPLLPGTFHLEYNSFDDLRHITHQTACVIAETIQAEAGVIVPENDWLKALRSKCNETGTLLVLDEIQCGFGRNGSLWAFEQYDIVPDILLLGKALGGGMPLGAFIANKEIMSSLSSQPVLGHINTFGGHPVSCTAGMASMNILLEDGLIKTVPEKEKLFLSLLQHPQIKEVRSKGLMIAVEFVNFDINKQIINSLIEEGVFTDWFLFASNCLRIVPPLTISIDQITLACNKIIHTLNSLAPL